MPDKSGKRQSKPSMSPNVCISPLNIILWPESAMPANVSRERLPEYCWRAVRGWTVRCDNGIADIAGMTDFHSSKADTPGRIFKENRTEE
jgi:hypothetical protein